MKEKSKRKPGRAPNFFKWQLLLALFTLAAMTLIALFGPFRPYIPDSRSSNVSLQIFYPLYFWGSRVIGFLLLASVIQIFLWILQLLDRFREREEQQDVPVSGQRLIVLLAAILLTFVVFVQFINLYPFFRTFYHQDSVSLEGKMYRLTIVRYDLSRTSDICADGYDGDKYGEYILYECDQFGWMCTNRVNEEIIPFCRREQEEFGLQVDATTNMINILHDGEVVYTYPE